MNCPFCKAAPRSDWGYECGTGPDANKQRSVRCRDAEIATLRDRIKRLEEAGDVLCENSNESRWDSPAAAARKIIDQSNWLKAKEAKP